MSQPMMVTPFEDWWYDWQYDMMEDYLERDETAYASLIDRLGEAGKELPISPKTLTDEQYTVLYDLLISQDELRGAFDRWGYAQWSRRFL